MGKLQFCRICRTENNLKYTAKELRQFNKKQLQLAQGTQDSQGRDRASKKLLLTTRTLGNICLVCDERIQIYHHLDDGGHDSGSDIEIDVVDATNNTLPTRLVNNLPNGGDPEQIPRPDTPVIVDDDDMLYNIFMQKVDQQRQFKTQSQQQKHGQQTLPQQQHQQQQQQQTQFVAQFQSPYTPPQSMAGSSEGDESKVIEVFTSRESTPANTTIQTHGVRTTTTDIIDQQGHRIVAIIDLDDNEDNDGKTVSRIDAERECGLLTPLTNSSHDLCLIETLEKRPGLLTPVKSYNQTNNTLFSSTQCNVIPDGDDDDEEIIFREVEPEQTPPSSSKKKKRKSYDEKQLRLVASLSLLSSDSETEENPTKLAKKLAFNTGSPAKACVNSHKRFNCNRCNIYLPDAESLSVHERIHQGVKCPVCHFGFHQDQRLIHHMRYKHREYNGDVLSEKPRLGHDSCMTIRLRYMHRTTFYECQLCGRIDEIFRVHKEHIIDKHPIESKSLKDPMMKQLKCPVCKVKCGAQYLSLCRHLIATHEYSQYKGNLRELIHVSAFGWNAARQQEVAKTARIYQFLKRKTFFFECKICRKVVAGYLHHLRHLNKHETLTNQKTKVKTITSIENYRSFNATTSTPIATPSTNIVLKKNSAKLLQKPKEKTEKIRIKENSIKKPKTTINCKKSQKLKKSLKLKKSGKSEDSDIQTNANKLKRKSTETANYKLPQKTKGTIKNLPIKSIESSTKLEIKTKLKPKDKVKLPAMAPKATKGRPKKNQLKKVKVKPSIRQIDLQKYKCKYCLKKFKGFGLFNLHLLRQHKENEYHTCKKCNKTFTTASLLEQHMKEYLDESSITKQNRKNNSPKQNCKTATKSIQILDSCELATSQLISHNNGKSMHDNHSHHQWLQDLLKLNLSSDPSGCSSLISSSLHLTNTNTALFIPQKINVQCCYCLHLFTCKDELEQHAKQQHSQKQQILIKYKPLTC